MGESKEVPASEVPIEINALMGSLAVAKLDYAQTFTAWERVRHQNPDTPRQKELETCQPVNQNTNPVGPAGECKPLQLGALAVERLDWHDRWFYSTSLKGPLQPTGNTGAQLLNANMMHIQFFGGDAGGIVLAYSMLGCANFNSTNLAGARFDHSDMRGAKLFKVDLTNAGFSYANLDGVSYEPQAGKQPDLTELASAMNLEGMTYSASPAALSELRETLYRGGMAEQAQKITFAIEHTRRRKDGASGNLLTRVGSWLRLVAFEWPVAYGMQPFRPLWLLLMLIPAFMPLYVAAMRNARSDGLWIRRPNDAISRKVEDRWLRVDNVIGHRPLAQVRVALWYSIMCAFRIGYKDVNVGDWITRLQPREYLLGATGWCRTVSGIQSLLSVYFLALTVLCILGRPFG
jgi:hypothetical protein